MTVVHFVPYGTKFEQIDPASLSATLTLSKVLHPLWGPALGKEIAYTDDGRVRYHDLRFANDNRRKVVRGLLNGSGPAWIGVEPKQRARPEEPSRSSRKPVVRLTGGALRENIDAAEANLLEADRDLYQRADMIVRPTQTSIPISGNRKTVGTRLLRVGLHHMIESFTTTSDFRRFDRRGKKWLAVNCPSSIAATYMERGSWRLPILTAVINAPTLLPDGTPLDRPGYDAATGVLYDPLGVDFPPIPLCPTRDEAIAALAELKEPIAKFPFTDGSGRSTALSAMLTAAIRTSLPAAPLHGFDAPTAGSGKSKLANIAAFLVTGHEAAASSVGKTEEEMEKRLGAILLAGDPVILLDNIERPLGGELLCQMLTQESVKIRILGRSEDRTCLTRALVLATGNNLQIVGDLTRRGLLARIDPACEQPEARKFDFDPVEVVKRNRPLLVQAALTVLRAFHVAGRPRQTAPLGSFEAWSGWVRDALIWCGEADPVGTIQRARECDPRLAGLTAILALWSKLIGNERVTVTQVIEAATVSMSDVKKTDELLEARAEFREALLAIAGDGGAINGRRLGTWLGRNKGRIVNGSSIAPVGVRDGNQQWQLLGKWMWGP